MEAEGDAGENARRFAASGAGCPSTLFNEAREKIPTPEEVNKMFPRTDPATGSK